MASSQAAKKPCEAVTYCREQAPREDEDEDHEHEPERHSYLPDVDSAEPVAEVLNETGSDNGADQRRPAAYNHPNDNLGRLVQVEHFRGNEISPNRVEHT